MVMKISGQVTTVNCGWQVNICLSSLELPDAFLSPLAAVVEKAIEGWKSRYTFEWENSALLEFLLLLILLSDKGNDDKGENFDLPQLSPRKGDKNNLAWKEFGVPSLIIRVDFTSNLESGEVFIYEIEERPAGVGLASRYTPGFAEKLRGCLGSFWPKVVVSPNRRGYDDHLWTEVIVGTPSDVSYPLIARFEPEELKDNPSLYKKLLPYSISTLLSKGWKGYGVGWLWEEISRPPDFNEIANKRKWAGAVFKTDGSKAQHVRIWCTHRTKREVVGFLRKSGDIGVWSGESIIESFKEWKKARRAVYLQKFYYPIPVIINSTPMFGVWRIYFAYDVQNRTWKCLGGFLNCRPSLLVHGASDSLFIPVAVS